MPGPNRPSLEDFFYRPDEAVPALLGAGLEMTEPSPHETEAPSLDFLAFRLGEERYATPIGEVKEILRAVELTEVPRGGKRLLGVMNLRGEITPVYEIKTALGLADHAPRLAGPDAEVPIPKSARVLVVSGRKGAAGVWADEVYGVVRLAPAEVEPTPSGVGDAGVDCLVGIGRHQDRLWVLIDLERALG